LRSLGACWWESWWPEAGQLRFGKVVTDYPFFLF
jgi:hypothetical protein